VFVGLRVSVGEVVAVGDEVIVEVLVTVGDKVIVGEFVTVGDNVSVGEVVGVSVGGGLHVPVGVRVGVGVLVGTGVTVLVGVAVGNGSGASQYAAKTASTDVPIETPAPDTVAGNGPNVTGSVVYTSVFVPVVSRLTYSPDGARYMNASQ
jgi:hypothetical protein